MATQVKLRTGGHVHCPLCNKVLTRPESEIAGIGPVCQKKIKFAESLESFDLFTMATARENFIQTAQDNQTLILKNKKGNFVLSTIFNKDNESFIFLNRNDFSKKVANGFDVVDSFLDSISIESNDSIEYCTSIDIPDHADLKRSFTAFNRKYQEEIVQREQKEKDILEKNLNPYYYPVIDKKNMTSQQLQNRTDLMLYKERHLSEYNFSWTNGVYQRSTFLYRISFHKNPEAIRLKDFLLKKSKFKNLEIKDYGLTDEEIEMGLVHSEQKLESMLFKAYSQSNRNINLMLALAEKIDLLAPTTRQKAYRALNQMLLSPKYTKEQLKIDLS